MIAISDFNCISFNENILKDCSSRQQQNQGKGKRREVCIPATSSCPIKFTPITFFNFANFQPLSSILAGMGVSHFKSVYVHNVDHLAIVLNKFRRKKLK